MRFGLIQKVAAVLAGCCALFFTACQNTDNGDGVLEVSVKSQKVDSDRGQQFVTVRCSGKWTLALVDGAGEPDWASLNFSSGTGNKSTVVLTYDENTTEKDRSLTIVLDNGSKWVGCELVQTASGRVPEENPAPLPDQDPVKTGWLELPAMDNPDLGYYSHSFEMNGKTYRNFSFGWSQKDLVALWVAYPLNSMYTSGNFGGTKDWAYDPLLGSEFSAAPFGGYGDHYDRGHQLPNADRYCSYEANAQTYYGTNMTPQLNGFNANIWAKLEGQIRTVAKKSDTTYVVTGCMVDKSTTFTKDSDGKKMTVPTHYFKAVLRYSQSSTLGAWAAAAFLLEHRVYSEKYVTKDMSEVMSVDELEAITGMDFFVNLPAKIGEAEAAKVEAADPSESTIWW